MRLSLILATFFALLALLAIALLLLNRGPANDCVGLTGIEARPCALSEAEQQAYRKRAARQ